MTNCKQATPKKLTLSKRTLRHLSVRSGMRTGFVMSTIIGSGVLGAEISKRKTTKENTDDAA